MTVLIDFRGRSVHLRPKGRKYPLLIEAIIEAGGTAKTSSITALAAILAERGYKVLALDLDAQCNASMVFGWHHLDPGQKTIYDVILGEARLHDAIVPARIQVGSEEVENPDDPDGEPITVPIWEAIENLDIIPSSPLLKNADVDLTVKQSRFNWFQNEMDEYEGDHDVILIDMRASYGRLPASTLVAFEDEDIVLPAIMAGTKGNIALGKLQAELDEIREEFRRGRAFPARPNIGYLLLCGVPTGGNKRGNDERLAVDEVVEGEYGHLLLPQVRYSDQAQAIYRDECPMPILAPSSHQSKDYNEVATALGFVKREKSEGDPDRETAAVAVA
ncbi:ParA family protein [Kitasatospora sp. NPDC088548]|uniref:ParA family protein n=1 Tax=Kitasatospora sp. NPDC088548 TaxID=3364075 RepID=UPI003800A054